MEQKKWCCRFEAMTPQLEKYLIEKYGFVDAWIVKHLIGTSYIFSEELPDVVAPKYIGSNWRKEKHGFTEITQSEFNAMVDEMYPINKPEEVDNSPQQPQPETVYDIANRLLDENHALKLRIIELEHAERMRELTSKL